jgi:hypothetical protein
MNPIHMLPAMLLGMLTFNASAQEAAGTKPLLIHTIYVTETAANQNVNVDSVLRLYKKDLLDPNPYYKSSQIVAHWYGHDSREILIITELNSWNDIALAEAKQAEIIKQFPESMKKVGEQWFSLNSPEHHADEIYRVVAE